MLLVDLTIYDGCSWSSKRLKLEFKNKKALDDYIDRCAAWMDEVQIHSITRMKKMKRNNNLFKNAIDKKALKKAFSDPKAKKEILNILNKIKL